MYLAVLAALLPAVLCQAPEITIEISTSLANPGDNVTVTCRVTNFGPGDLMYWFKMVTEKRSSKGIDLEMIATMTSKLPPYSAFPRYVFTRADLGDVQLFILNIYGVQTDDSGQIGCSWSEIEQNVYDLTRFEVYKRPRMVSFEKYTASDKVTLTEGQKNSLVCRVERVLPVPRVTVSIRDHDVTDLFTSQIIMNTRCKSTGTLSKNCSLHFDYDIEMRNDNIDLSYTHDGHKIKCTAELLGSTFPPQSTEATLVIYYSPKITAQAKVAAHKHAKNFVLSAVVQAKPPVPRSCWHFEFRGKMMSIMSDQQIGDYSASQVTMPDGSVKLQLIIDEVLQRHFTTYEVLAGNDINNSTHVINLQLDDEMPTANAPASTCSLLSSVTLVLVHVLLSMR